MDRRELLKSALAGTVTLIFPSLLCGQANKIAIVDGGGTNVVAFSSTDGLILVDSGAPMKTLATSGKVTTVFNTHYHLDVTGNNEQFASLGAKIIAHEHTRQWMSTDYWVPEEDRYEKARPKAAQPTASAKAAQIIVTTGRKIGAGEGIRTLDPDLGKDQR